MADTLRAFIAVELPETALTCALKIQDVLKSLRFKMKWIPPENMHLTLKFLGDIHPEDREKIEAAVSDLGGTCGPVSLAVSGMGVFPGVKKARVVWCGLKGDVPSLIQLQHRLDERLTDLGFPKEKRPFKGHLTLARIKGAASPKQLVDAMQAVSGIESAPFQVEAMTLFRSDLRPTGAVYTPLKQVLL